MDLKSTFLIFLLPALFSCRQQNPTTLVVDLGERYGESRIGLAMKDSVYQTVLDSTGQGKMVLPPDKGPEYAVFTYSVDRIPCYINPGGKMIVTLKDGKFDFKGRSQAENHYLNSKLIRDFQYNYRLEEKQFFGYLNEHLLTCYRYLDSLGLDADFVIKEKQRLYYDVYLRLARFPEQHAFITGQKETGVSAGFSDSLLVRMKENEALSDLSDYRYFFRRMIETYCRLQFPFSEELQNLQHRLEFVDTHIRGGNLAAYLVDEYMTEYVSNRGVDGVQNLLGYYSRKVSDPVRIQKFRDLYGRWAKVAQGQFSPDFCYPDPEGHPVSLADLKGKYVYIDLWATWCYFCCREIPPLKKLEEEFKDRNICFVSISCDKDTLAWKKKVQEEKLGGIQLICGTDRTFREVYQVSGIPCFILLDPEGKIIRARMTRPSDPRTREMLRELPGI